MPGSRLGQWRRYPAADDVPGPTDLRGHFSWRHLLRRDVWRRDQLDHAWHTRRIDGRRDHLRWAALGAQGLADQALIAAATASFVGGTISVLLFTGFAPPLAEVALAFGAPEEFA